MTTVLCIGQAVQDFVFSVDAMPDSAEKYRASAFKSIGGGPAATAAVAIAGLGGKARLAARIGDDPIADVVVAELESYGVDCTLVRRFADRTSSLSTVLVDSAGERLIVNYLDPAMETITDWLPQQLPGDIDAVLADTRWPEGALHALQLARKNDVPAVLDADLPVPADGELIRAATHVAFSAAGLAEYSGDPDPAGALRSVSDTTDAWCCVTLGSQGTLYMSNGGLGQLPAYEVKVRDTLGAGDVWHGAFALALADGQAIDTALQFASVAAALKVKNGGGRSGSPTRQEVDQFLQQHSHEGRP
jgi:sulfofructose kinase